MGTLDDLFVDKKVLVEVNLYSVGEKQHSNSQTILYEGIFQGVKELGPRQMYVLKNAEYWTPSGATWDDSDSGGSDEENYIRTEICAIPVENVLSISLERKDPEEEKE